MSLTVNLPVYTGLVETARANNRLGNRRIGIPQRGKRIDAETLLPAAQRIYETTRIDYRAAATRTDASALPRLLAEKKVRGDRRAHRGIPLSRSAHPAPAERRCGDQPDCDERRDAVAAGRRIDVGGRHDHRIASTAPIRCTR